MHRDSRRTPSFRSRFGRLLACESGAVAVIVALLAPVLIGAMGMGAESGYWYLTQREFQNAADVAVHAAARQSAAGEDAEGLDEMAAYLVVRAGVDLDGTSIEVNQPPLQGDYVGNDNAVEIIISRDMPRMFTAIYMDGDVPISARAVAVIGGGTKGCVMALSTETEGAVKITGSSSLQLEGCEAVSNGPGQSIVMEGHTEIDADCIHAAGTVRKTGSSWTDLECDGAQENAAVVSDPLAGVPEPALVGACKDKNQGNYSHLTSLNAEESHPSGMKSMRFCNGLSLKAEVAFGPGLYLIEGGDFKISGNTHITGDGVVFYLAEDVELDINGYIRIDLSAPTTGPYAGITLFSSRDSVGLNHKISGNSVKDFGGAFYAPTSEVSFNGSSHSSSGGCSPVIAGTITVHGHSTISIDCSDTDLPGSAGAVTLVE